MGPKIFQHVDFRKRHQEEREKGATEMERKPGGSPVPKEEKARGGGHLYYMLLGERRVRTDTDLIC